MRIADNNWFEMYCDDCDCIIRIMYKNMNSDLECGYDPLGKSITEQREMIDDYIKKYHDNLDMFKTMPEADVNRWCYYELKKKGAIA